MLIKGRLDMPKKKTLQIEKTLFKLRFVSVTITLSLTQFFFYMRLCFSISAVLDIWTHIEQPIFGIIIQKKIAHLSLIDCKSGCNAEYGLGFVILHYNHKPQLSLNWF